MYHSKKSKTKRKREDKAHLSVTFSVKHSRSWYGRILVSVLGHGHLYPPGCVSVLIARRAARHIICAHLMLSNCGMNIWNLSRIVLNCKLLVLWIIECWGASNEVCLTGMVLSLIVKGKKPHYVQWLEVGIK